MPAWGVDRRRSAQRPADPEPHRLPQLDPDHRRTRPQQAADELAKMIADDRTRARPSTTPEGEALFNLGIDDGFAGGAYSCGRCHTGAGLLRRRPNKTGTPTSGILPQWGPVRLGPSLCNGRSSPVPGTVLPRHRRAPAIGRHRRPGRLRDRWLRGWQKYGVQARAAARCPASASAPAEPRVLDQQGGASPVTACCRLT